MVTVYKETEIDVDLSDFETSDLIDELKSRDEYEELKNYKILNNIADAISMKKTKVVNKLICDLIFEETGRIVNFD